MRWMMIVLFASVAALLIAAAGVARHIRQQRAKTSTEPPVNAGAALDQADEADLEFEP